jgi:hemerythrin superfamily protein
MPELLDRDACELLDADHLAVKHLFVEYARLAYAAPDETGGARSVIANKICDELTVHAQIEEEIFYPALREAVPRDGDVVDEAIKEHQEAKELIAEIRDIVVANRTMDQLVAALARVVEDHVKEERDELFPKAKAAFGLDLIELGAQLQQRQAELMQSPPA